MVVPGRGFLLNNELTDFSTVYDPADPNRIEPGKRPRSSMSPTIILKEGKPFLALGSPGGSTIITTVLQTVLNRVDLGMTISGDRRTACLATEYGQGHGRTRVHRQVRQPAGTVWPSAHAVGGCVHVGSGDRRRDRHRVSARRRHGRRRRARQTRRGIGDGPQGVAEVEPIAKTLILINGLPGSGKTTLSRQLGRALSIPVISKDNLKEALADIAFRECRKRSARADRFRHHVAVGGVDPGGSHCGIVVVPPT